MDIIEPMEEEEQQQQQMQYQHTLLYVVQRCWHSGPKQHVPVDLLRLFHTQREAEEAAYHSAKAFHAMNARTNNNNSSNNNNTSTSTSTSTTSGVVKTIMLPSYPAHNPQGSSYGFLACGGLFWVRALRATVVTVTATVPTSNNNNNNNGTTTTTTGTIGGGGVCNTAAYAILTEGVIGGTGNRNSRRGTEVCDGRVFGGDATARVIAMEAVARVKANLMNTIDLRVDVRTVPVGKPADYSSGAFLKDWPQEVVVMAAVTGATVTTTTTTVTTKRPIGVGVTGSSFDHNYGSGWGRTVSQEHDEEYVVAADINIINNTESLLEVDCPFEQPVAKRRRLVSVSDSVESSMTTTTTNIAMMQ